jgi:diphthamide biosynthesis protein 7
VRVRRDGTGTWGIEVLGRFEEHASMNYGSDVRPDVDVTARRRTIVSTSFYDRRLCLWYFDGDEEEKEG